MAIQMVLDYMKKLNDRQFSDFGYLAKNTTNETIENIALRQLELMSEGIKVRRALVDAMEEIAIKNITFKSQITKQINEAAKTASANIEKIKPLPSKEESASIAPVNLTTQSVNSSPASLTIQSGSLSVAPDNSTTQSVNPAPASSSTVPVNLTTQSASSSAAPVNLTTQSASSSTPAVSSIKAPSLWEDLPNNRASGFDTW